ncbi:hypothetical protein ACMD2_01690 [Ananas comosus]|uniref:Uncharacterized protein n=1 Tax=Ananas comosus TaxID=4615 RepID=A0A199VJT1_ANACO|nr:hypothetical protein ACMD2_01690 [Ananas comosus]
MRTQRLLLLPISIFRWPELSFSTLRSSVAMSSVFGWMDHFDVSGFFPSLQSAALRRWWLELDFSVIDSIMWSFVTAFESIALVAMLCFFFLFCGCTF